MSDTFTDSHGKVQRISFTRASSYPWALVIPKTDAPAYVAYFKTCRAATKFRSQLGPSFYGSTYIIGKWTIHQ